MDDWWQQCKASVEDYRRYPTQPEYPKKQESTWQWEDFVAAAEAYEKEHPEAVRRFNGLKF